MPAEDPDISLLGEGRFLKLLLHIEAVLFDLLIVYLIEKLLDLWRVKAGFAEVEITSCYISCCQRLLYENGKSILYTRRCIKHRAQIYAGHTS
jgi:hypothetical protein